MENKRIITWIHTDDASNSSYFPQIGGDSASLSKQKIYWRCVAVFFYTAHLSNPDKQLLLFTNSKDLPIISGVDFTKLFVALNVEVIYLPENQYIAPKGYYSSWINQFYIFSIIQKLKDFAAGFDLILDSDSLILKNLDPLFTEISKEGAVLYSIENDQEAINGLKSEDMENIYSELLGRKLDKKPRYYGGEFYAASTQFSKRIMEDFDDLWKDMLSRNERQQIKFTEEAHMLSFLYYKYGIDNELGSKFIRRIWTDSNYYRDVQELDIDLPIWHLLSEKRYGFKRLFKTLIKKPELGAAALDREYLAREMSITTDKSKKRFLIVKVKKLIKIIIRNKRTY